MVCAKLGPLDTVMSMIFSHSASVFTAEIWAIVEALEQIKYSFTYKYYFYRLSFVFLYMKLEHPLIRMVIRTYVFLYFANKEVIKSQTLVTVRHILAECIQIAQTR